MKNSTLFSNGTSFKDSFYCCCEGFQRNFKFLLILVLFMTSFTQGVSAQGTLVPSCNLVGPLEACAVSNSSDTSGDIIINIEVARSGAPNLLNPTTNLNFVYSFPSNTAGAFIRTYGNVVYNAVTNRTTQTLVVFPGSNTPEFNLQLNATNSSSSPITSCECSKSVSVSRVAATSSYLPIACYGQTSTLTVVGQYSDIQQYTYTLLPSGPTNTNGIFTGLTGSLAGTTYVVNVESAEGCVTTTSQTIYEPALNPAVLNCPTPRVISACESTNAINLAFNNWLASFTHTGGTNSSVILSPAQPVLPALCGGTTTVTWTVTDQCGEPQTCSSTFQITPAPAVVVTSSPNATSAACSYANQAAADAAYNAWLAGFTVTGGCQAVGGFTNEQSAPAYCGGTRTVTYVVADKCYEGSTITRTFVITPAPAVVVTASPNSSTNACSYADQAAVNAAFTAWLNGFTVTGGCQPSASFGEELPTAPLACGGSISVTYAVSDKCYEGSTITRTFEITPAPAVVVTSSPNSTTAACSYADQAAANAAYNAWLAGFTVTGGCQAAGGFTSEQTAPAYCGGTRTVTYVVADKCYQGSSITRTFEITPAPAVVVTASPNSTTNACSYADQAAVNAAFTAWLNGFTVTGGCQPSASFGEELPTAPLACGGSVTVTYSVSDKCYEGSSITRTFEITPAPAVVVTSSPNATSAACSYADQAAADAAYNAWLAGFTVTGGCQAVGGFTNEQSAPAYCGGTRTVTYVVSDKCYQGSSITRTFVITPAAAVVVTSSPNATSAACSYADQAAVNAAFTAWLNGFTVTGGCQPSASFGEELPTAPLACGGSISVTYAVSDKCYEGSTITRTFEITPAPAVVVTSSPNSTTAACSYADQAAADAAYNAWLAGFTVTGGCQAAGGFTSEQTAPPYCGGTRTVTYVVSDKCYQGSTVSSTFTITPAPAVIVNASTDNTTSATIYANQAAADAAYNAWLAGFNVAGGCNPSGNFTNEQTPPSYCGGTRTVTYTVTDKCYVTTTYTATFTITPATPAVVNGPDNSSNSACIYADQAAVNAAFATWLAQFTVSGGINPTGSFGEVQPQAPTACGGQVIVTYTVNDRCFEPVVIVRTFTITPAPALVITKPDNSTASTCTYADQAAVNAAFAAWLNGFTVSGGCAPSGVLNTLGTAQSSLTAPLVCGGSTTVYYAVSDKCYAGSTVSSTFTVTPAAAVVVTASPNSSTNACSYANQAAANAAFAAWLNGFTVTGGCQPSASFGEELPTAPLACGGSISVTYTVSDKCYDGSSITRTFEITPAPAVVVAQPENSSTTSCSYTNQAAVETAFAAWLAQFTVTGGCSPTGIFLQSGVDGPRAPLACGGSTTVTYEVSDKCYEGPLVIRTFEVTPAPAVVVTSSPNATSAACSYADQAAVNAAFAAWLNGFTVTGGCQASASFGEELPTAPLACGGSTTVTYTVSDKCYEGSSITRTFEITPAPAVVVTSSPNATSAACSYADQAAADAAYNAWLAGFTVTGGCQAAGGFTSEQTAPAYCGGTRTVTYVVADKCYTGSSITRTFVITPAAAVVVTASPNSTTNACSYANQAAVNAAFATWLNGFTVTGGCAPSGSFGQTQAPAYCGGTTSVTYTVSDKCYEGSSITRTFEITPAPAVVFNCGNDVNVPACSTQAQVNAAYAAFKASVTATGGCVNGTLTNNAPSAAPSSCGGSVTVTWTYNVTGCGTSQSCTKTFTVAAPAPVVINCGNNVTLPACSTQAELNAAWNAFLSSTTATGGCNGVLTRNVCSAPSLCGGYVDVTWTYTVSNCGPQSGCGNNTNFVKCTKRFTVTKPAPVVINCGNNVTLPACSTQAELTAAWNTFLSSTTASGGCGGVLTRTQCSAPSLCGGYVDVTWTYTVASCGQQSGCGTTNYVRCTKRFTVTAPTPVKFTCGTNVTLTSCKTQAQVDAAYASFLASTTATGGCGGVLTNNAPTTAPSACGGFVDVTWTYNVASCGQQSGCGSNNALTCTKRFTVPTVAPVVINCGSNVTVPACSTQSQVTAAWNSFLASTTASGGCGGVLTRTQCVVPPLCGGSVNVTWTYTTTSCGGENTTRTCTKTFTVATPAPVVLNCGNNVTLPSCSTQAEITAAWNSFLASTTASGGCNGNLTRTSASAPSTCGGYVDVTWTYTVSTCGQQSGCGNNSNFVKCTKRFTVTAPPAVTFNCGSNVTVPSCSTQAEINTAWNTFLASTSVTGGCSAGTLTNNAPSIAPSTCGGYVDVTWTYRTNSNCGQTVTCNGQTSNNGTQTCTKRFTVAAPPAATLNCANNVTVPACSTQAEITSAWNSFLASTTVSGGCSNNTGTLTNNAPTVAPSTCGGYVDVTWTYRTNSNCGQTVSCGGQSSSNGTITCTKRFTVASAPAATLNCANNVTVPSCSTQAEVTAAWNSFLASTTVSGGCPNNTGTLTNNAPTVAPSTCGGYVDVTWTYRTNNNCGQSVSCGGQTSNNGTITCTKRFTVAAAPAVSLNCANNVTVPSCSTQAQVTAAWNSFLASTTVSGGCSTGTLTNNAPTIAPSTCGGYVDVTWTYRTNNNCGQSVSCGGQTSNNGTITCTKRFTVAAPSAVTFNCGSNVTLPSCKTQAQVNAAWLSFLCSTTVSGGCSTGTLTNNAPTVAPSACGGYVDVTWTYRSNNDCGQTITCGGVTSQASTITCTKRFTVTSGGGVDVQGPGSVTYAGTSFYSQAAVNTAFNNWLCQFKTISSGCGSCAVFSGDNRCAPSWTNGGSVRVTYSISGNCNSDSVTATFTITRNGATCKVTDTKSVEVPMAVKAYPNPFSENFSLDLTTTGVEKVAVAIYDMTGKLIEQRQVNAEEVSNLQIGDRFASGVYNVIVTQGSEVKTLRVIKR